MNQSSEVFKGYKIGTLAKNGLSGWTCPKEN